jgi:hypothetical protein
LADASCEIVDRVSIGAVGTRRRSCGRSAAAVLDRTSEAHKCGDSNAGKHGNEDGALEGRGIRKKANRKPGAHAREPSGRSGRESGRKSPTTRDQ